MENPLLETGRRQYQAIRVSLSLARLGVLDVGALLIVDGTSSTLGLSFNRNTAAFSSPAAIAWSLTSALGWRSVRGACASLGLELRDACHGFGP